MTKKMIESLNKAKLMSNTHVDKLNNSTKPKKVYQTLFRQRIEGAFDATAMVNVSKQGKWINVSLTLFNAHKFTSNDKEGIIIQLPPLKVKELITALQEASNVQFQQFEKQRNNAR